MWHPVSKLEDLKKARSKFIELEGKEIAVFLIDDALFATSNFCPHRGGPLFRGAVEAGPSIRCPLHGWNFDLKSGACLNMPQAKVDCYPVEVRNNEIFVQI